MFDGPNGKIVSIYDSKHKRDEQIELWLRSQICREYGEGSDDLFENVPIRILTKFNALSGDSQNELYGYAKGRILGMYKPLHLEDLLWSLLKKGSGKDGSWGDIEEFANLLIMHEKVYKQNRNNTPVGGDKVE